MHLLIGGEDMKRITDQDKIKNVIGGGAISSFVIGFVLKKAVTSIYNYYYNKGQGY